ncbi:MAG TPA: rhodanese-related sulfurtransferase [Candidatus Acidoferrum sp.]|nr:rhodanese-related sulfurtransferase [Candidatus Acidoferrum sp.]
MQKIILYYKFAPVADPEAVKFWQRALCDKLGLKGRILISQHGINGTLGGDIESLKAYVKETKLYAPFKGTQFKWSEGGTEHFPRLQVTVRPEVVAFDALDELQVDQHGVVGGGKHLTAEQIHQLVAERGEDVVFFDGRDQHEAAVGRFKNAVIPNVRTSRDFKKELDDPKYNDIKDKPVVTYCTGGIRCEILSVLMKNRGFKEVYQIDGGIAKYGEAYKDDGLWEGKLYVFDGRLVTGFSDKAKDIGRCVHCNGATSNYENCANAACNQLVLICNDCTAKTAYCSDHCLQTVAQL